MEFNLDNKDFKKCSRCGRRKAKICFIPNTDVCSVCWHGGSNLGEAEQADTI